MRLFTEVELPETCYVSEAALWVSLGRAPTVNWHWEPDGDDEYRYVDGRVARGTVWDGGTVDFNHPIQPSEFQSMGIEVDYTRYEIASTGIYGMRGAEILEESRVVQEIFDRAPPHHKEGLVLYENLEAIANDLKRREQEQRERETKAKEADWAKIVEQPFEALLDRGQSKVFEALSLGKIGATGWQFLPDRLTDEPDLANNQLGPLGHIVDVPSDAWTYRHFDWKTCSLQSTIGSFDAVQVSVSDMLAIFPIPLIDPKDISGTVSGGTIILSGKYAGSRPAQRTKRGRPQRGEGVLKLAMLNEFDRRLEAGQLPDKKEAILEEAMQWAADVLLQTVPRTTARYYLKPLLDRMSKNNVQN